MEGLVFGRYRITERLGEGGMAEVWTAKHEIMDRYAAVKLLLPEMSAQKEMVQRFFNEAQAAARIEHPGTVEIFDVGFAPDGRAYLVMEILPGETLQSRLERKGTLGLEPTTLLIRQLAGVMDAAHEQGIVHRDLKPENLFIVPDPDVTGGERVKVLDFGLAKLARGAGSVFTAQGAIFGTPAYMAPEQCRDSGSVDKRADLYAIGCIFFRCLCGHPPFGTGGINVMRAQVTKQPPRPRRIKPEVPLEIEALILQLLEKQPCDRVQSCKELIELLDAENPTLPEIVNNGATLPPGETSSQSGHAAELHSSSHNTSEDEQTTLPRISRPRTKQPPEENETTLPYYGKIQTLRPTAGPERPTLLEVVTPRHSATPAPAAELPAALAQPAVVPGQKPSAGNRVWNDGTAKPNSHQVYPTPYAPRKRRLYLGVAAVLFAAASGFAVLSEIGGEPDTESIPIGTSGDGSTTQIAPQGVQFDGGQVQFGGGRVQLASERQDQTQPTGDQSRPVDQPEPADRTPPVVKNSPRPADKVSAKTAPPVKTSPDHERTHRVMSRTATQYFGEIRTAYRTEQFAQVSKICKKARGAINRDRSVLALCAIAACRQNKPFTAKQFMRKLPEANRTGVLQSCLKVGVDLTPAR